MLSPQRQNLPVHFLKFGVDDHGVIVPMLRRGKDNALRLGLLIRPLQLRLKDTPKSR